MKELEKYGFEEREDGYFQNGKQMTNFTLEVIKIHNGSGGAGYFLPIKSDGNLYEVKVLYSDFNKRFLRKYPLFYQNEQKFYALLRSAILQKKFTEDEILCQPEQNGLQKISNEWIFICSNVGIDKAGFHPKIYSDIPGMYFPDEAQVDLERGKENYLRLFEEYNKNSRVFYILFLNVIMAIVSRYFREINEPRFMKITVWLSAPCGSGKTELARVAGTFLFRNGDGYKTIVSATGNRKYFLRCLAQSSGNVLVLDDVKKERVTDRKDKVKKIVDDCLRSVFQGSLTENSGDAKCEPEQIDACAVITGEYFDTEESQNGRMIYLNVDEFLKDEKNSEALRALQENPLWLTSVCGVFIQWFLRKTTESSFPELLKAHLEKVRKKNKIYTGIKNAERLNENYCMLDMAAMLMESCFQDIGMPQDFVSCFSQYAKTAIRAACDDTFRILGGEHWAVQKILEKICSKCCIRLADYVEDEGFYYPWKYRQEIFWISKTEDFVYIKEYQKSLLEKQQGEHDKYEDDYLIITGERFARLFKDEMAELLQEYTVSSSIVKRLQENTMKTLKEMQIIYKKNRSDSDLGRSAAEYPVYRLCTEYSDYAYCSPDYTGYEKKVCEVALEPVIQINLRHPYIKTYAEGWSQRQITWVEEEAFENVSDWNIEGVDVKTIYKARDNFRKSKSLYKK